MNKTTENLWRALENYVPPKTKPTVYKLVYDPATGKPLDVTTTETDQPYIEITRKLHEPIHAILIIVYGRTKVSLNIMSAWPGYTQSYIVKLFVSP